MSVPRTHAPRAPMIALLLLGSAALVWGAGVHAQQQRPTPQIPALTPEHEAHVGLPAEMRAAVLHLAEDADQEAALRRCTDDDFSQEPLPEFHPHAAPAEPHYVDLGFLYFEGLDEPYRSLLGQMSREDAKCALLDVPAGTMVVRRMMEYAPGGRPAAEREAYRQRVGRAQVVADLAAEVFAPAEGIEAGAGATDPPGQGMVPIAGGVAWLGSTEEAIDHRVELFARYVAPHVGPPDRERYTDELLRPVQVAPFLIDRTEVTVRQYGKFAAATGQEAKDNYAFGKNPGAWPMVYVSLRDAALFCHWRGKRLPTAAEWELAARGKEGRRYPWGDEDPDGTRANFCDRLCNQNWATPDHDDGERHKAEVGSYPAGATPEGVLDMAGNVREWCADLLPDGRALVKGGGYHNAYDDMTAADVRANEWWLREHDIGFRCAMDAP